MKRIRITKSNIGCHMTSGEGIGIEIELPDDADEEKAHLATYEALDEYVDFAWEWIDKEESK